MAEEIYKLPEEPVYSENIRKLQDSDPASASAVFNPLFARLIENIAAVKRMLEVHDADPTAHANRLRVIAARVRDPSRPTYGLDGSGDGEDSGGDVALEVGPESGTAEFSAIVSGVAYDAKNISSAAAGVPDGTLIVRPV